MTTTLKLVIVVIASFGLSAQTPVSQPASIRGQIVDATTRLVIRGAVVTFASSSGGAPKTAESDTEGKFAVTDLTAGTYRVSAVKNGYTMRAPQVVTVIAGSVTDLSLKMTPGGIITGRVLDERGKPMPGVQVYALSNSYVAGQRRLDRAAANAATDDRGEFRLFWLDPKKYYLAVDAFRDRNGLAQSHVPVNPAETYVTTYFPGTTELSRAVVLDVQPGETHLNDMRVMAMRTPVIRGVAVFTAAFPTVPYLSITLRPIPPQPNAPTFQIQTRVDNVPERFQIAGVPPGKYELAAIARADKNALAGRTLIELYDSDLETRIVLNPLIAVKGRVLVEGAAASPVGFTGMRVSVVAEWPSTGTPGSAVLRQDGSFAVEGLAPGHYRVRLTGNVDGYLAAARLDNNASNDVLLNGFDLPPTPSDLILTMRLDPGRISGRAQAGAIVLLIPDAALRSRAELFRTAVAGQEGNFEILRIPPGKYSLYAFEEVDLATASDPEFLRAHESQARQVEVKGSELLRVDLAVKDRSE